MDSTIWEVYIFPIIIALVTTAISIYFNNASANYSARQELVRNGLMNLHKMKAMNIYDAVNVLIKNEKNFEYDNVIHMQDSLENLYKRIYYLLINLKLYVGPLIQNDSCNCNCPLTSLRYVNKDINYVHVIVYVKWANIVYKLKHDPNYRKSSKTIYQVINYVFNSSSSEFGLISMNEIMRSLKEFNDNLDDIKNYLNPMNNQTLANYDLYK